MRLLRVPLAHAPLFVTPDEGFGRHRIESSTDNEIALSGRSRRPNSGSTHLPNARSLTGEMENQAGSRRTYLPRTASIPERSQRQGLCREVVGFSARRGSANRCRRGGGGYQ